MELYGYSQGFNVLRSTAIARPSKKLCTYIHPIAAIFLSPLTSKSPQAAKNGTLSWAFQAPRVYAHRKNSFVLASAYSRDEGSREESGPKVETPGDANLDESPASQTATVSEDERVSNRAESIEEIGKALSEMRKEKVGGESSGGAEFWRGVLEETAQIEWPSFQKVLGTTGVVLAVMIGSSAVLLTVNAIFAEISDKVFDGIGVQDVFGGVFKG
eukprot:Gb_09857 [translate_table: standard]